MSILATKLYIPPTRPGAVLRPRLIERLNAGLQGKLTLIAAPAGFGKSTLVSEWLGACEQPVAWLSLDEEDNDPKRFLAYLVAALQSVLKDFGETVLAAIQSPQPPPSESILTVLINEINANPHSFVLVLDDFHLIEAQATGAACGFLLEHLPAQMHLVIATRKDPQLPLARLRARAQLSELRVADLRFTSDETAEFLNRMMGLNLSVENVAELEARTEGWIAGLQLAAISMQGHKDCQGFINSFTGSHTFVLDYLLEEVLHQQSEGIQNYLLCTSILDRLCESLCDAVVCDPSTSGQETLNYLVRANLFVIPLDEKHQWHRYHHLFADVLHARAMKKHAGRMPILHQRASVWFEQNGQLPEAIRHALTAEDYARAADLIELVWPEIDRYIQSAPWLGWVQALPDEIIRVRPVLRVNYGWALLDIGRLEAGEAQLQSVEKCLSTLALSDKRPHLPADMVIVDEEQFRYLPATIASARAYLAQSLGDTPAAVKYAKQTLALVPADDHVRRGSATVFLGISHCASGDLEAAYETFADGMAELSNTGDCDNSVGGVFILADIRVTQGRLFDAACLYENSLQDVAELGYEPQGTAYLYLGLSKLHREWGNPEIAKQHLLSCENANQKYPLQLCQYRLTCAQAITMVDAGDLDAALGLLGKAQHLYYRNILPDFHPISALVARIRMTQGHLGEAFAWVREQRLSVEDELSFLREFEHISLVRLLIAQYKKDSRNITFQQVLGFIKRLLNAALEGGRTGSVIELFLLQALAHHAHSDEPAALSSLQQSLSLAEPEAYVRIFVDAGSSIAQLLSAAMSQGIYPDYAKKLLMAFEVNQQDNQQDNDDKSSLLEVSDPPVQSLIEPLSLREIEVLKLIAQGLSNQEIGETLFLAIDTVKGHNRRIFSKLGVQRRTEAVAKARSLHILPHD